MADRGDLNFEGTADRKRFGVHSQLVVVEAKAALVFDVDVYFDVADGDLCLLEPLVRGEQLLVT